MRLSQIEQILREHSGGTGSKLSAEDAIQGVSSNCVWLLAKADILLFARLQGSRCWAAGSIPGTVARASLPCCQQAHSHAHLAPPQHIFYSMLHLLCPGRPALHLSCSCPQHSTTRRPWVGWTSYRRWFKSGCQWTCLIQMMTMPCELDASCLGLLLSSSALTLFLFAAQRARWPPHIVYICLRIVLCCIEGKRVGRGPSRGCMHTCCSLIHVCFPRHGAGTLLP